MKKNGAGKKQIAMKRFVFWGSASFAALVLGLGSAVAGLFLALSLTGETQFLGPWRIVVTKGSQDASHYVRAAVALRGLLTLNEKETVYYTAATDSSGDPLSGRCSYRLVGHDLPARWWSITVYGTDSYLIPNVANRYSISDTTVIRSDDGSYEATISANADAPNGLPVQPGEGFELTIRLYNPEADVRQRPSAVDLPTITSGGTVSAV